MQISGQNHQILLKKKKKNWGALHRQERLALDFSLRSVHIFSLLLHEIFFNLPNKGSSSPLCHQVLLITVRTQVPNTSLPRLLTGVVTERDAWSLWSVSQQQTVHTSRQCLGIVAHFRTSVHDTVSVVKLSSLVPRQINFVHLYHCAHLCASTQA